MRTFGAKKPFHFFGAFGVRMGGTPPPFPKFLDPPLVCACLYRVNVAGADVTLHYISEYLRPVVWQETDLFPQTWDFTVSKKTNRLEIYNTNIFINSINRNLKSGNRILSFHSKILSLNYYLRVVFKERLII